MSRPRDAGSEWREKRDKQLDAKDKASKEKNAALERDAKQALDKFYQEYKVKKEAQLKKNRCVASEPRRGSPPPAARSPFLGSGRVLIARHLGRTAQGRTKGVRRLARCPGQGQPVGARLQPG